MKGKKFEYAVTFMLELSRVLLDMNLQVGFLAFNDKLLRYLRPNESQKRYTQLWEQIYDLQVLDKPSDFRILSELVLKEYFTRGLIFVLTDSEGDLESKSKEIRKLRLRNNHVVVIDLSTYHLNFKTPVRESARSLNQVQQWVVQEVISKDAEFLQLHNSSRFKSEVEQFGCYYFYVNNPQLSPFSLIDSLVRLEERRRR